MSLLKKSAVCTLLLLVSFLLLSLFLGDLRKTTANSNSNSNSAYEGCEKRGDDFLVNFPRDCLDKHSPGSFKISNTIFSSCKIKQSRLASTTDSKSEVILSIPISDFLGRSFKNEEGNVVVELASPLDKFDVYSCGNQKITALVEDAISAARQENKEPQLIASESYKIIDLPRSALSFFIKEDGRWSARRFPNRNAEGEDRYNLYFKKNSSGALKYRVNCLSWNNECHGDAVGLIAGRYNYTVYFPKSYEGSVFEIMDKTYDVLSAAYAEN